MHAATVYRDRRTGKAINLADEAARIEAEREKKQLERRETRRRLRAERKAAQEKLLSDKLDAGITAAASEPPAVESLDE